MVSGLTALISALASGDDIPVMPLVFILLSIALILVIPLARKQQERMAQYMCFRGELGEPIATSRVTQRSLLIALPLVPSAIVIVGLMLTDDTVHLIVTLCMAVLILVVLSVAILMSRVVVVLEGMCVGAPSAPMMLRLPFEKIQRVTLSGRMLKVTMTEKISTFAPMDFRYVVLGDTRPLGATLQALALTRGTDIVVENVEIDQKLLSDSLKGMPRSDEAASVGGAWSDRSGSLVDPSGRRAVATALLQVAGVMAVITGIALLAMDNAIADEIGHHSGLLGCCWAIEFLFGALAIIGGHFCSRRKKYRFVLVSAVFAILSFGFFVSTVLGIVALVLVIKSEEEFED